MQKQEKPVVWARTKVQCLVWHNPTQTYYARARVGGKLHWKSLSTDSVTIAKARLAKALVEFGRRRSKPIQSSLAILTVGDAATIHRANVQARVELKPSTKHYWNQIIDALLASWPELADSKIGGITEADCRDWAAAYQPKVSATRYNNTVDCLRDIFDLAIGEHLIHDNPAAILGKVKVRTKKLELPSREQFAALVSSVRSAGGWCSKQCGDLIEFLAYSGARIGEAEYITWDDVDLAAGKIWIHGDPATGTKNWERRQIPIIPALEKLLVDMRDNPRLGRDPKRTGGNYVLAVTECQKAIDSACQKLKLKRFTHHDLRHLFATACIESGVDIPAVAHWLGHKDGGALAMKTYGHLRDDHSVAMAKKVTF
jgi:integrase